MAAPLSFFARPAPLESRDRALQPAKRVATPIMAGPSKRVKSSSSSSSPSSPSDSHYHKHDSAARARDPLTPHASSDAAEPEPLVSTGSLFKPSASSLMAPPSMRRAPPTPGTSTVAASSSPRRGLALSSSPRMGSRALNSDKPHTDVLIDATTTLVFGRHRPHRVGTAPHAPPATAIASLAYPDRPARTVCLDRSARHASRVHAVAERTPHGIRLVVLGQNGVKIRGDGPSRRLLVGTVEEFVNDVTVDFYGATVAIRVKEQSMDVESDEEERERALFTPEPVVRRAATPLSLPPSSPPVLADGLGLSEGEDDDDDDDDEQEMEEEQPIEEEHVLEPEHAVESEPEPELELMAPVTAPSPAFSRGSSPLSDCEDEVILAASTPAPVLEAPVFHSGPAPTPGLSSPVRRSSPMPANIKIKQELVAALPSEAPPAKSPTTASGPPSRVNTPVPGPSSSGHGGKSRPVTPPLELPEFPAHVELPALLINTIVFSGASKLSLPEVVKMMLESQPALRDHGNDAVWAEWCRNALDENPMFGKVARNGKDRSGRPLQPHYFYDAAADPDPARSKELGGLVRPLRAAQRAGGKAIDWRPVGAGRRRYW